MADNQKTQQTNQQTAASATGTSANPPAKAATPAAQKPGSQPQPGIPAATGKTASPLKDQSLFERFNIPETVKNQFPDLIPLILQTESMNDDERQYWFQILPIMTDEQVQKLREILVNEKKQLEQLDKDYEKELKRINTKHVSEWKEFESKERRQKLQAQEKAAQTQEQATEEDLLKKLQGL